MLGIGSKLPSFEVTGVKPGFQLHEEKGQSAFETLTETPGQVEDYLLLSEGLHVRLSDRNGRVLPPVERISGA